MVQNVFSESLPPYAQELLAAAVDISGFPLVVAEEHGIGYDDVLSLAGEQRPFHKLAYVPAFRDHRLHFLVNACCKIQRIFEHPPDDRLVPVGDALRSLPKDEERELRRRNPLIPAAAVPELSRLLYQGLLRQVVSMPFDIRVERDIAATLPEHAGAQARYLERQVQDLERHFDRRVARFTPPRVYAAITAMNLALAEEASQIADIWPGEMFRASPHLALGERLWSEIYAVEEPGHVGDRILTDRWAELLGVAGWYEWRRLDSVR